MGINFMFMNEARLQNGVPCAPRAKNISRTPKGVSVDNYVCAIEEMVFPHREYDSNMLIWIPTQVHVGWRHPTFASSLKSLLTIPIQIFQGAGSLNCRTIPTQSVSSEYGFLLQTGHDLVQLGLWLRSVLLGGRV